MDAAEPSYQGDFYLFSSVKFSPKPSQRPHPPIWIGGGSKAALRRAARLGDGWHPTDLSPEQMAGGVDYLKAQLDLNGRSLSEMALSIRLELEVTGPDDTAGQGPMIGTPERLLESVEAYRRVGVEEIVLSVSTADVDRIRRVVEAFATRVISRARG